MKRLVMGLFLLMLAVVPARAVQPDEILSDPALESRARALSEGLRCLVCQNQSIDDSNAPLARDLRILIRERLEAGVGSQQYGEELFGALSWQRIERDLCVARITRPIMLIFRSVIHK